MNGVEIVEQEDIPLYQMEDGQIGIITQWAYQSCIGNIVQRYDNSLVSLGQDKKYCWPDVFTLNIKNWSNCRVRILPPGTTLRIK